MGPSVSDRSEWRDERLRYQVLRFIFDQVGRDCDAVLTGDQIRDALALPISDVFRTVTWLDGHGYVHQSGSRPSVGLTSQAIEYLESFAGRRHSLRT